MSAHQASARKAAPRQLTQPTTAPSPKAKAVRIATGVGFQLGRPKTEAEQREQINALLRERTELRRLLRLRQKGIA